MNYVDGWVGTVLQVHWGVWDIFTPCQDLHKCTRMHTQPLHHCTIAGHFFCLLDPVLSDGKWCCPHHCTYFYFIALWLPLTCHCYLLDSRPTHIPPARLHPRSPRSAPSGSQRLLWGEFQIRVAHIRVNIFKESNWGLVASKEFDFEFFALLQHLSPITNGPLLRRHLLPFQKVKFCIMLRWLLK